MKHALVLSVLAVALAPAATAASTNGGALRASGSKQYADPAGDSGAAADVTSVEVSHTDDGKIRFAIALGNREALNPTEFVTVFIDTDRNDATGPGPGGTDYVLAFGAFRWVALAKIVSTGELDFTTPQTTLFVTLGPGVGASINSRELGNTKGFDFYISSWSADYEDEETAPDGDEWWTYLLQVGIDSAFATSTPTVPRAGKRFSVSNVEVLLADGQRVKPDSYTCKAVLGGRTIRPTGRCTWTIPANARGKKLVVSLTVSHGGARETFTRSFRVR
jgi:hypothetical protein